MGRLLRRNVWIEAGISLFLMFFFIYFYCHIDGWVIESWANYVCQTAPVYPFRDAAALWHSYGSDAYSLRQTALQVFDG